MEGIILFSDDHIYSKDRLESALFEALRIDIPVLGVHTLELASEAVKSVASFKALILDWQYSNQNTEESFADVAEELGQKNPVQVTSVTEAAALKFLQDNDFYSLIYIFSELDIEESHGASLREKFGDRVRIKRKNNESFNRQNIQTIKDEILTEIENWNETNKNLAVPIMWSVAINESIQKIFKELSEANQNWLKEIYDSAKDDGIDPALFVIELLQLLLGEAVIQNKGLLDEIEQIGAIKTAAIPNANLESHSKSLSKLFCRLHYSELLPSSPIMTGDIFTLDDVTYGIVITPECDISYIKNTNGCEFELLTFKAGDFEEYLKKDRSVAARADYAEYPDKRKNSLRQIFNQENSRLHILPSLPMLDADGKNSCIIDFRVATKRISSKGLAGLPRTYKINSPFIQQLRQRYLSHIGRVGTPALPAHVRDWNLG